MTDWRSPRRMTQKDDSLITGIYSIRFLLNNDPIGAGIAVLNGTALHGGGVDYLYKGTYQLADNHGVSATLDLENYTGTPNPVPGLPRSYRLTLNDISTPQGFTLSGEVDGYPQLLMSLELTKIGELVD